MNKFRKLASAVAVASVIAALSTVSVFAETRHPDETDREFSTNSSRRNIVAEGRIQTLDRQGDGYRVRLAGDSRPFHVPAAALHDRSGRGLQVGLFIRLGGWLHPRGHVSVSSADWSDHDYDRYGEGGWDDREDRGRRARRVDGYVQDIDFRRGTLTLRDDDSRRRITVLMKQRGRGRRSVDFDDLRRGDFVSLRGDWIRGGLFEARRIESVETRQRRRH